jgi:hypothetical protein
MGNSPEVPTAALVKLRKWLVVALLLATLATLFGAVLGAVVGALAAGQLLVDSVKQHGKLTDLLWIGVGTAIGAGLALLWGEVRKRKAKKQRGTA